MMPTDLIRRTVAVMLVLLLEAAAGSDSEMDEKTGKPKSNPGNFQTIKFSPANLTDEDQHSMHMPKDLRCDGCRIIAYLMTEKFQSRQKMVEERGMRKKVPESEILDMVEHVCLDKGNKFQEYGVKDVHGEKRLSGPGLETKDIPGIMQGGGRWPHRLQQMCGEYVGELGEEEMFVAWQRGQPLEDFICHSEELGNICGEKTSAAGKVEL